MNESVLDLITDALINERLDEALLQNPEYIKIMQEIDLIEEKLSAYGISDDVRRLIGELASEYLTHSSCYGKVSYQRGFMDGIALMSEIGLIKRPNDCMGKKGVFQA